MYLLLKFWKAGLEKGIPVKCQVYKLVPPKKKNKSPPKFMEPKVMEGLIRIEFPLTNLESFELPARSRVFRATRISYRSIVTLKAGGCWLGAQVIMAREKVRVWGNIRNIIGMISSYAQEWPFILKISIFNS